MKIGFFVDGPMFVDKENKMYGVALNENIFRRYFVIADEINICTRIKRVDDPKGLSLVSSKKLSFTACPNMSLATSFLHKKEAREIVLQVLRSCDGAMIRLPGRISQIAVDCCERMKKPYMVEMVGCPWDAFWNHSLKGKLMALPFMLQTRSSVKKAPAVLYVTNGFLQRRYPTYGMQVGCSDVELHSMDAKVLEKRLTKIKELDDTKIVIGTAAAVNVKYKGQQYIIKALGRLKKQGITNYEYQLVGNGDQSFLTKVAQKYNVEDQVKFLGRMPHDKIFDWLDSIDIYVQPSRQEGLPRALIEAMSRGLPAFGAKTGGIPELIDDDMLFSNTNKNLVEIEHILSGFSKEMMIEKAKKNFEAAQDYQKDKLEEKRVTFYKMYFGK